MKQKKRKNMQKEKRNRFIVEQVFFLFLKNKMHNKLFKKN